MMPVAREIAKLSNEATSLARRLRNLSKRVNQDHALNQQALEQTMREIKERQF